MRCCSRCVRPRSRTGTRTSKSPSNPFPFRGYVFPRRSKAACCRPPHRLGSLAAAPSGGGGAACRCRLHHHSGAACRPDSGGGWPRSFGGWGERVCRGGVRRDRCRSPDVVQGTVWVSAPWDTGEQPPAARCRPRLPRRDKHRQNLFILVPHCGT